MTRWLGLLLLQLCGCGLDDRRVDVRHCIMAPDSGVVATFSTARLGRCDDKICPDAFAGTQIVALGPGDVAGRVVPLHASPNATLALGLRGDLSLERDDTDALRVALQLDTLAVSDAGALSAGFALELTDCIAIGGSTSLSFNAEGTLGDCPLRAALRFADATREGADCTRDPVSGVPTCAPTTTASVDVSPGVNTLSLPHDRGDRANTGLGGVEWEATLAVDPPRRCDLVFTIDDIRIDP